MAALAAAFYRSGALVFGGGHVVLPLLRDALVAPGLLSQSAFLAGYGAAQALPGPLFAVAADFGALAGTPPAGLAGGVVALAAIFLPGLLALVAALPFWRALRRETHAQAAMAGINAAVVGLLAAALYNPAFVSAVSEPARFRRRGGGVRAARRRTRAAAPRRRPRRGGGRGARRVKRRITPPSSVP